MVPGGGGSERYREGAAQAEAQLKEGRMKLGKKRLMIAERVERTMGWRRGKVIVSRGG